MSGSFSEYFVLAAVVVAVLAGGFGYAYVQLRLSYRRALKSSARRTREYQLLTQIGQAIHSRLDPDAVLQTVHKELGQLFEVDTFTIAFAEGDTIRFEYRVVEAVRQPKHSRKATNAVTEHIIKTGQPLLIKSEMDKARARLGLVPTGKGAKCYCGVPIFLGGRPAGVMAALSYTHEFAYDERDVEVMQTAAAQVSVAIENARLFAQEQRRAHYLELLNNISAIAISSQDAELMLAQIIDEVQKNFSFDHIGIGVLDYATKELEIKAQTGTQQASGAKRVALDYGIMARAARTHETVVLQHLNGTAEQLKTVLPEARSVVCIPISYGDSLLGVLNVESVREDAFMDQEILMLRTLADLLATALHNTLVFQRMQQQSITDSLTGIKTRRFFLEALQAEWQRASRNAQPFSILLIDLDKFKEVNDTLGHLEGDLVLARVARVLEQKVRHSNVVARYGGDEFVILMPETNLEQGQMLAERLRLWLATDPMLSGHRITGSFGLACYPVHGAHAEDVLRVADASMYVSKKAGGNSVSTAEDVGESEEAALRRNSLDAFIQGFIHREHAGPESAEELISTLAKFRDRNGSRERLTSAIDSLTRAAETREVHAAGHGEYVARYAAGIAAELGLPENEAADIAFAARIHDVGKIIIPEKILCKPGSLSPEESYLLKMHSAVGARIVEALPHGSALADMVRHHHEQYDGSGYPAGLRGDQSPLGARILHVADAFINMITERPFAKARSESEAVRELEANCGTQFDPAVVRAFVKHWRKAQATAMDD